VFILIKRILLQLCYRISTTTSKLAIQNGIIKNKLCILDMVLTFVNLHTDF